MRPGSFFFVSPSLLALGVALSLCASGCRRLPPAYGGPIEVRRGYAFLPTRFYQDGHQVHPDSAQARLSQAERSSDDMKVADGMQAVSNLAAITTWGLLACQLTNCFDQVDVSAHQKGFLVAESLAFGLAVGFAIGSESKVVDAAEAYNAGYPKRAPEDEFDSALPPPMVRTTPPVVSAAPPAPAPPTTPTTPSANGADPWLSDEPPPSALQVEHAKARGASWLFALGQRDPAILASQMEVPVIFRGISPDAASREACAPGGDLKKVLNVRVTDAEGLAKVVTCLLSDAGLLAALSQDPALLEVRLVEPQRMVGALERFALNVSELRRENLVLELRHVDRPIVYGFLAVRKAGGDEVGSVSAVIIARAQ